MGSGFCAGKALHWELSQKPLKHASLALLENLQSNGHCAVLHTCQPSLPTSTGEPAGHPSQDMLDALIEFLARWRILLQLKQSAWLPSHQAQTTPKPQAWRGCGGGCGVLVKADTCMMDKLVSEDDTLTQMYLHINSMSFVSDPRSRIMRHLLHVASPCPPSHMSFPSRLFTTVRNMAELDQSL